MGSPRLAAPCCHSVSSSWHEDITHTRSGALLSKRPFVGACCEQSRQKALRKSHQPSFFAPRPEELPLDIQPRVHFSGPHYVSMFTAASAPRGAPGNIIWKTRWKVWESVSFIEWCYCTQAGSHRVTCEEPRPLLLEANIFLAPGLVRWRDCRTN